MPDPRFTAVARRPHDTGWRYYYTAYAVVSRRLVPRSNLFWRKRDADDELASGRYRPADRVARVDVIVRRPDLHGR